MSSRRFILAGLLLAVLPTLSFGQVVIRPGTTVTGTSLNVQTLSTGTVLNVSAAASADRRYVGMSIDTQFSTLEGVDTFVLSNTNSAAAAGGIASNGRPQAVAIRRPPFRPAQVGNVVLVDNDKPLLARAVKAATLKGMSIKEVVQRLADASKENIVLGVRGLQQVGVDVNAKHDFALPAGTMKDSLLAVLKTAVPEQNMVIDATDKVVMVSTQAQADQVLITRTYYLEDLLARVPRFVAPGTDLNQVGMAAAPTGIESAAEDTGRAMDLSRPPAGSVAGAAKARAAHGASTDILSLITDTVRPEIWVNHGGKSEASMVGDRVTIRAPASVHALLDGPAVHNPNKIDPYVQYGQ